MEEICMIIEGNEKEIEAMEQFHKGNRQEGLRLQEEFASAFREEYKEDVYKRQIQRKSSLQKASDE